MNLKTSSGSVLIESLVSFFIVTLVLGTLLILLPSARKGMNISTHKLHAAFLAKTILEESRSRSFSDVKPVSGAEDIEFINNGIKRNIRFNYALSVETKDVDKKDLWCAVSWKEGAHLKEVTLETVLINSDEVLLP